VPDQYASNRIIYTLPGDKLIASDNISKSFVRLVSNKKVKEANYYG
jgi:hypothetical protein